MTAMESAHFEDLQGRLRALLIRVGDQLPVETAGFVDELIDSSEFGIALETMSEALVEAAAAIDAETLAMTRSLADAMELGSQVHARLAPLVEEDRAR